jgi:hypothetical protein
MRSDGAKFGAKKLLILNNSGNMCGFYGEAWQGEFKTGAIFVHLM